MDRKQRLLVSVRGPKEALIAVRAGAQIADVEYPASALGTPYPLNIRSVRASLDNSGLARARVSTNIGEVPFNRANSCQAALGVAAAGADLIKFGLAEQTVESASYLGKNLVRTVKTLFRRKKLFPAVFVDNDMCRFLDPFRDGHELVRNVGSDGLLIDTFNKLIGKSLLDYCSYRDISRLVTRLHKVSKEVWIAGSLAEEHLPALWQTGVDVICVRGAACSQARGAGRFGEVEFKLVKELVSTIPRNAC